MTKFYRALARIAFCFLALLIPLAYLPVTVDPLEVNKQSLLLIFTAVIVIAWLGVMVVERKFVFQLRWIFLIVGLFLTSTLVSTLVSLAPYTSWVGSGVQEYTSFFTLLAFGLLFVVGVHLLGEEKVQQKVWSMALVASAYIGATLLFDLAGIELRQTNFIGTPNALALYLIAMAVLGSGLWLVSSSNKEKIDVMPPGAWGIVVKVSTLITVLSALVVSIAIDYWMLWVAILLATGVMFTFALLRAEEFPSTSKFVLPMTLFVVAILFVFLPSVVSSPFAIEVSPTIANSMDVAVGTWNDTSWFFGSGPGTYVLDYTKHAPIEINATQLWDVRFDRGSSAFFTMLPTFGLVGVTLFVVFLLSVLVMALKVLITERVHAEWKMTFVAFCAWIVLAYGFFVYSSNITLSFFFWLLSAVLVAQAVKKAKVWEFSKSPRFGLLTTFCFVLVNVGLLTILFVTVSRYASELSFAQAVRAEEVGEGFENVIEDLETAARLNRLSDVYARNLAQARLYQTGQALNDPAVNPNDLVGLVQQSIEEAERAVRLSPNNVVNYSLLGDVYRELSPIANNADILSIEAYTQATELAPNNPKYHVALGRSYLVRSDQLEVLTQSDDAPTVEQAVAAQTQALERAASSFVKAIELKPDYASAHYFLSITYVRQGNLTDAIAGMEAIAQAAPYDVGVMLQLGLLYLQQGRNDLARAQLERAVEVAPNYSNARWYLASVYEQDGDTAAATEQLQVILDLNPGNSIVEQRLERLKAGPEEPEALPEPLEEGEIEASEIEEALEE